MRVFLALAWLFAILSPAAVQAAPLPFTGSLSVALGTLVLPAQVGTGTALVNGGFGGALQLLGGSITTTTTTTTTTGGSMIPHVNLNPVGGTFATKGLVTTVTGVPFVNFLTLTNVNGPGSFALGLAPAPTTPVPAGVVGTGVGGFMPILGAAHVCLFCTNPGDLTFPVPLSVAGVGGTAFGGVGGIFVTVWGAPWTTATAVAITTTSTFGQQVFHTAQGFDTRTASGGQIQLVTPIVVRTNVAPLIAGFATMTLDFSPVPEPGTLALGLGALALLGGLTLRAHRD